MKTLNFLTRFIFSSDAVGRDREVSSLFEQSAAANRNPYGPLPPLPSHTRILAPCSRAILPLLSEPFFSILWPLAPACEGTRRRSIEHPFYRSFEGLRGRFDARVGGKGAVRSSKGDSVLIKVIM